MNSENSCKVFFIKARINLGIVVDATLEIITHPVGSRTHCQIFFILTFIEEKTDKEEYCHSSKILFPFSQTNRG